MYDASFKKINVETELSGRKYERRKERNEKEKEEKAAKFQDEEDV